VNGLLDSAKINRLNEHILDLFNRLFTPKKYICDLTHQEAGLNYFFDPFNQGIEGYLTSQETRIKPGVHVLLSVDSMLQTYEVKEVSSYASPEDLRTAYLVKVSR
jgi:hypothetical protein